MTRDDVIRLAREAGFDSHDMSDDFTCNLKDIERFAALVIKESQKVNKFNQPAQKKHEIVHDPAEIRRVFEIDAAEYPEPESGFMKL